MTVYQTYNLGFFISNFGVFCLCICSRLLMFSVPNLSFLLYLTVLIVSLVNVLLLKLRLSLLGQIEMFVSCPNLS